MRLTLTNQLSSKRHPSGFVLLLALAICVCLSHSSAHAQKNLPSRPDSAEIDTKDPQPVPEGHEKKSIEGWTVLVNEKLWKEQKAKTERALELLTDQLILIRKRVPAHIVNHMQKVPLWMSPQYPGVRPRAEYHPGVQWLKRNKRNPLMVKAVEFSNINIFEKETKRMPLFVLHELAHAYHDQVLGFDYPKIRAAWVRAVENKSYDSVERNNNGRKEKAYAITNPMEYFAESTEAYFGINDFFPYNNKQLQDHDPTMYELLGEIYAPRK